MEMGNDSMLNDLFLFLAIPQICLLLKAYKQSDSKINNVENIMLMNNLLFFFSLIDYYLLLMEFINRDGIFYVTFERFNNIIYFEKDKNIFCKVKNIFIHFFILCIVDA